MDKALTDLRLFDLSIDLHGSRALGIHQPYSNTDVLTTRPLQGLLHELEEDPQQQKFKPTGPVLPGGPPPWCMPPKLKLLHIPSGIHLDVISRWSADIFVRDRDAVAHACIAKDERVQPFLTTVVKWAKGRKDFLPGDQGYPNSYCFRLFALHFLMARVVGVVLPPMKDRGTFLNEESEKYAASKKIEKTMTIDDLALEFLEHLGKSGKPDRGLWADLRNPYEPGPVGVWQVIDPPTHKKLLRLTSTQIHEISKMAKLDAKALKSNKGHLENL